jgi:UDP-N-acetylglucosamine 2-epimerase
LIGNSSSGILEAPTFKKPVINLGRRQDGRIKAANVIQGEFSSEAIRECINKVQHKDFLNICSEVVNPYGSGDSSKTIVDILQNIEIDYDFLTKQITF